MDIKRIVLYLALALLGVALWNAWQKDHPPEVLKQAGSQQAASVSNNKTASGYVPPTFNPGAAAASAAKQQATTATFRSTTTDHPVIKVKTDTLQVS